MSDVESIVVLLREMMDDPDWDCSDVADLQEALPSVIRHLSALTTKDAALEAALERLTDISYPSHKTVNAIDQIRTALQAGKEKPNV